MVAFALGLVGCSGSTNVPENVVANAVNLLEELRIQVEGKDYEAALKTVAKLEDNGSIDAGSMTDYLANKARAEMGAGKMEDAKMTIEKLDLGSPEVAVVCLLRGELELKNGNRSAAQTEFAKAKAADASIVIPKM